MKRCFPDWSSCCCFHPYLVYARCNVRRLNKCYSVPHRYWLSQTLFSKKQQQKLVSDFFSCWEGAKQDETKKYLHLNYKSYTWRMLNYTFLCFKTIWLLLFHSKTEPKKTVMETKLDETREQAGKETLWLLLKWRKA